MLTVHHLETSRSQRILWLLEELGVPYEMKIYRRDPATRLAPAALKAIHPLGKSPVITDDGQVIAESGAIIEYLVEKYGAGRGGELAELEPARGTPTYLQCRYWMHYAEGSLMNWLVMKLVFTTIPKRPMPFFAKPIARAMCGKVQSQLVDPNLQAALQFIEGHLERNEWFAGPRPHDGGLPDELRSRSPARACDGNGGASATARVSGPHAGAPGLSARRSQGRPDGHGDVRQVLNTRLPFSILDLVPVTEGSDVRQSFTNMLELAQLGERLGYRRFWLAEHHNMPGIASAATAVLIGHVAGGTSTIRVGAGGIMLPNHAPLQVAEQFGTLASLYPGRIDLGLGRAPGTDQAAARALRRYYQARDEFPADVVELMQLLRTGAAGPGRARRARGRRRCRAVDPRFEPVRRATGGAARAAVRASRRISRRDQLEQALAIYRSTFRASARLRQPHVMLALNVVAAPIGRRGPPALHVAATGFHQPASWPARAGTAARATTSTPLSHPRTSGQVLIARWRAP